MSRHRSIPPGQLANVAWRRILREVRTRTAPTRPRAIKVGSSVREIAEQLRERQTPRFFGLIPEQAALLGRFFPHIPRLTIQQADGILKHRFDLLGSGERDLGKKIDWQRDFKNDHSWPLIHYTRLTLTSPQGGFDVKVPWELSRFHHALRLGQAYLYTQDEIYAKEIVDQITSWIKANPYGFGVNWAGPMDVAIRAVNWIWACYFIIESEALTAGFLALLLTSLCQHGEHLLKHLEDGWPRTNHLIANLAGLAYLGIMFPEFPEAARWKSIGLPGLWRELERQTHPDGINYEASTAYHRLVTEMVLSVAALCIVNGVRVPETVQARLRSMLDVIMAYTQPDGLAPQIGDVDDGRLLPLTIHADPVRMAHDHRHLLGLGSLVLERELPDWAGFVDPAQRGWSVAAGDEWQDAFWYFASDAAARFTDVLTRTTQRPENAGDDDWIDVKAGVRARARALAHRPISVEGVTESRGFEAGGLYVIRDQDFHLTIDAGGVGQGGAGGHAHNDTLSLTLCAYGRLFLVDPGSYAYTSDPAARNTFRSTAYHNTLQVGDHEINRRPDDELFSLGSDASVTVHRWVLQSAYDLFEASHSGYERLKPGVIHRRQIWFDKVARLWILHDRVDSVASPAEENGAEHRQDLTLWFHFAPMPARLDRTNNAVRTENLSGANLILLPLGDFPLEATLEDGWYSPRYGVREKAPVAKFTGRVKLPADLVILLYPHQTKADVKVVRAAGRAALINFRKALSPAIRPGRLAVTTG
jgi:hypothetical protein